MIFADEPTGALNRQSSNEVMEELCKINADGTTVMLVTHDAKVAAKCSRVLYIVDGNIQGEYNLIGKDERTRERALVGRVSRQPIRGLSVGYTDSNAFTRDRFVCRLTLSHEKREQ